jgi:excisionase family DNA binding protein
MSEELSLQEAADLLDVHYMTAYRYVRLGLLQAAKSGGTWRVRREDLEAFRDGASSREPLNPEESKKKSAPWSERLELRLLAGDARGAWGVVEAALAAGAELDEIYTDVVSPALVSIGDKWSRGELEIYLEHRASAIVASGRVLRVVVARAVRFSSAPPRVSAIRCRCRWLPTSFVRVAGRSTTSVPICRLIRSPLRHATRSTSPRSA